ncbi:sulfatase-like hydrolase/transferase [Bacteroidota bacterium]
MTQEIKRREFIGLVGGGMAAFALPGCISGIKTAKERPNILWISCEDINSDLGCYGNAEVSTPNIDRLASQGIRYTNAFTVASVCAPNRSGIITAMYPTAIGSMHMRAGHKNYEVVPPPYVKCFTEYLRAEGYYCTNRGKTDYQFMPPITAWDRNSRNHYDWRGKADGQPFFSVINHYGTHESKIRPPHDKELNIDPASVILPPYYPDSPVVRRDWARYLDNIDALDKHVGEILERLEQDGLAENTVVFFWSDHGRGLPRAKRWLYDSGIHVPLIIRWPGKIKPCTTSDDLVSSLGFGPTVMSIAGVEIPSYMQGKAFLGEQASPPEEYIFAAGNRMGGTYDNIRCVRDKQFKYIRNYQPEKPYAQPQGATDQSPTMKEMRRLNAEGILIGPEKLFFRETKPIEELYDITLDPHEINNLAGLPEYTNVLERMRKVHESWKKETIDLGHIPEDELINRMWPGNIQPETEKPSHSPNGGTFKGSATIRISCLTEGASIGYTTEEGDDPIWKVYTNEIKLTNSARLKVRAIRIGYKESTEVRADFVIT